MSNQITEAFVTAFDDNFRHVAQQSMSRFEMCVRTKRNVVGSAWTANRLGKRTAQQRTSRHSDTPIFDQPHSTRFGDLFDWHDGDMVDDYDTIRTLIDPKSDYVKAMMNGLNRAKDLVIVAALQGNARATSGNVALTAGQKIAAGGTNLTKAKIIQARQLFRVNEADEEAGEELYFAYGAQEMTAILSDTTLTSADYMAVKMLMDGSVNARKWMGFTWVPSELLTRTGTTRQCLAWAKSGLELGIGGDIVSRVGEDPGKGFNVVVYCKMSIGAVRIEEEKVVQIDCTET